MRKGAAYGLVAWLIYGIVEFALVAVFPVISSDYQISAWQWPLIGELFLVYALAGLVLGAVGGALRKHSGHQAMASLTLVAAFILNLLPAWPLARSENIALIVAIVLASAFMAALLSESWQKRTAFLQGPWTVSLLLLISPWLSQEAMRDSSALVKFSLSLTVIVMIPAVAWIAFRIRSRRPATLARNAAAVAAVAVIFLMALRLSGKGGIDFAGPDISAAAARIAAPANQSRPNVILITMDTVRADHLPMYGYERNTTPHVSEFARTATLYTRAIATGDFTLPTHASMFTGLYPAWHGANFAPPQFPLGHPLGASSVTLADQLRSHEYWTASMAANRAYLSLPMGLMKGFGAVQSYTPIRVGNSWPPFYMHVGAVRILKLMEDARAFEEISMRGSDVNRRAFAILSESRPNTPFFLFLNYMDAHPPYLPPAPYDTLFPGKNSRFDASIHELLKKRVLAGKLLTEEGRNHLISQYDGGIAYMDEEIGKLLAYLRDAGLYDNTLIIITSDHGEAFGEHGHLEHALNSVYQDQIHVPLLIKYPRQTTPEQFTGLVSQVDLMPAILGLAGVASPSTLQGRGLQSAASGPVFAESRPSPQCFDRSIHRTILDGSMKLIVSSDGGHEAYNLETDPGELHNLYDAANPEVHMLEDRLIKWIASMPSQDLHGTKLDKQTIERLKSLGYVQ